VRLLAAYDLSTHLHTVTRMSQVQSSRPEPESRHDRTFIPRPALHRHAVEPIVHWATIGPPTARDPLDNRAPTRR
jgi:hypothetical protein